MTSINNLDDRELIVAIKARDESAYQVLVLRHTQTFYRLAVQTLQNVGDAEDVIQLAFVKLWQNPRAFDPSKSKFTTWFYRVVINLCRDKIKQRRRSDDNISAYIAYSATSMPQSHAGEDQGLEHNQCVLEQQIALEYAIARLGNVQREALNLVVYAHLPQSDAAKILGMSLKALESVLHRAKKQLSKDVCRYMSGRESGRSSINYDDRSSMQRCDSSIRSPARPSKGLKPNA